jgi:hypothetical protein
MPGEAQPKAMQGEAQLKASRADTENVTDI